MLSSLLNWTKEKEHFHYASTLAQLDQIRQPHINIAILERRPSQLIAQSVNNLFSSSFHGFKAPVVVDNDVRSQLEKVFLKESIVPIYILKELIEDIEQLIYQFGITCDVNRVTVHLKTIVNDACSKFHVDGYRLRLLCSYAGPGTEWTFNHNVDRKYLGFGENDQIIKDWSHINQLNSYDVAILKGELPHQRTGKGIVHRSPAIEHEGARRLVLRIDI